jgi:hypothetical protein
MEERVFEPDSGVEQFILLVRNFKPWSVPVPKYSDILLNELGKGLLLKSFRKVAKSDDCRLSVRMKELGSR